MSAGEELAGAFRDLAVPTQIDRFRILSELGRGGLGIVYLAYDPQLDRKIALKVLQPGTLDETKARESTLREAKAVAKISHPNVVAVYDVAEHHQGVFIAMEYVRGRTLSDWRRAHPDAALPKLLELYLQAGRGLAAAHAEGIVHRDFKPANTIVGDDGRVRVLDFGLARRHHSRPDDIFADTAAIAVVGDTLYGSDVGTPAYMAPEQTEAQTVGPAADQFAFCVALWEALTGTRPFPIDRRPRLDAIKAARVADGGRATMPGRIRRALQRGMAYQAGQRFDDLAALLRALGDGGGRRWRWGAVTGAWLVGGLAFAFGRAEANPPDCEPGPVIDSAWADESRQRVRDALSSVEVGYAADVADRIEARGDAIVAQWSSTYREACTATKKRGDMSAEQYEAVYSCLEQVRRQLFTRVGILTQADAATVRNAGRVMRGIRDPGLCVDPEIIERHADRSGDSGEQAQALWQQIDSDMALLSAGRITGREDSLSAAIASATGAGMHELLARAAQARGRVRRITGQHEPGQEDFELALRSAIAAGDDGLAARIAVGFSYGKLYVGDFDGAHQWLRLAQTYAERVPSRMHLRAEVLVGQAETSLGHGEHDEAAAKARRAIALAVDPADPDQRRVQLLAHQSLARVLHQQREYTEAFHITEQAIEASRALHGPRHPLYAGALRLAAVVRMDGGDAARAVELFEAVDEIVRAAQISDSPLSAATNAGQVATAYNILGRHQEAAEILEPHVEREGRGELGVVQNVSWMLGVAADAYAGVGRLHDAERAARRAVEIQHEVPPMGLGDLSHRRLTLSRVLIMRRDLEGAAKVLASVAQDNAGTDELIFAYVQAQLGILDAAAGRPDQGRLRILTVWPTVLRVRVALRGGIALAGLAGEFGVDLPQPQARTGLL